MTLDTTVHVYYQPLPDKICKSQPTLIPNLFEGTVFVVNVDLIWSGFFIPETKNINKTKRVFFTFFKKSNAHCSLIKPDGGIYLTLLEISVQCKYLFELKYLSLALVVFEKITKSVFCDFTI
jgi:hypothetical protein